MKICTYCKEEKSFDQFRFRNKAKNQYVSWCKLCFSNYEKEKWKTSEYRRQNNKNHNLERRKHKKQMVKDHLKNCACVVCGNKDFRVLEFDHINRKNKKYNISDMAGAGLGWKTILNEIKKCQVLCANCHRIKTYENKDWIKA